MAVSMDQLKFERKVRFNIPSAMSGTGGSVGILGDGVDIEVDKNDVLYERPLASVIQFTPQNAVKSPHSTKKYVNGMLVNTEMIKIPVNVQHPSIKNESLNFERNHDFQKENVQNYDQNNGITLNSTLKIQSKDSSLRILKNQENLKANLMRTSSLILPQIATDKNDRKSSGLSVQSKSNAHHKKPLREIKSQNNIHSSPPTFPIKTTQYITKLSPQKYLTVPKIEFNENLDPNEDIDDDKLNSSSNKIQTVATLKETNFCANKLIDNSTILHADKTYVFDFLERWRRQRNFMHKKFQKFSSRGADLHTHEENQNQSVCSHICFRLDEKKRRLVL